MARSRSIFLAGACLLLAGCPHKAGITIFSVEPPLTCSGKQVTVKWAVDGRASLHADPAPTNWSDQTQSQGELPVSLAGSTTFTLSALDANPADGKANGVKHVQVNPSNKRLGASAPCDAATHVCSGTFTLSSGGSLEALKLANPSLQRAGSDKPRDVCVTPPNGSKACVAAGASVSVTSPADGPWKIETQLTADEAVTPPPQLHVDFDFGCP